MENKRVPRTRYLRVDTTKHISCSFHKGKRKKKRGEKREKREKNRGKKEWKKKKIERVYITVDKRTRVRGWNRHGSN